MALRGKVQEEEHSCGPAVSTGLHVGFIPRLFQAAALHMPRHQLGGGGEGELQTPTPFATPTEAQQKAQPKTRTRVAKQPLLKQHEAVPCAVPGWGEETNRPQRPQHSSQQGCWGHPNPVVLGGQSRAGLCCSPDNAVTAQKAGSARQSRARRPKGEGDPSRRCPPAAQSSARWGGAAASSALFPITHWDIRQSTASTKQRKKKYKQKAGQAGGGAGGCFPAQPSGVECCVSAAGSVL